MNSKYNQCIIYVTLGFLGSISVGMFLHNSSIFDMKLASFQFVAFGLIIPILYVTLKYFSVRVFLLMGIFIYALQILLVNSFKPNLVIRDLVFIVGFCIAVFLFNKYVESNSAKVPLYRIIVFIVIMMTVYFVNSYVLGFIFGSDDIYRDMITNLRIGIPLAFGVGIGLELSDRYILRKKVTI